MAFIVEFGKRGSKTAVYQEYRNLGMAITDLAKGVAKVTKNSHHPASYEGYWQDIRKSGNKSLSWHDDNFYAGIKRKSESVDWFDRGTFADQFAKKK